MLVKTIKYIDYDGEERTEEFRFNLTAAELTDWELTTTGGLVKLVEKIIAEKDRVQIVELFKALIEKSYGEKSPDGKRFVKSPELFKAFSETEAYSILYMELVTDSNAAVAFVTGVIPQNLK